MSSQPGTTPPHNARPTWALALTDHLIRPIEELLEQIQFQDSHGHQLPLRQYQNCIVPSRTLLRVGRELLRA